MFTSKARFFELALCVCLIWPALAGVHAADPNNPKLKALLRERLTLLQEVASQTSESYESGRGSLTEVLAANQAVGKAEFDLCDTDKERLAVLEKMLEGAKQLEKTVAAQVEAGVSPTPSILHAKIGRLDIELDLQRLRDKTGEATSAVLGAGKVFIGESAFEIGPSGKVFIGDSVIEVGLSGKPAGEGTGGEAATAEPEIIVRAIFVRSDAEERLKNSTSLSAEEKSALWAFIQKTFLSPPPVVDRVRQGSINLDSAKLDARLKQLVDQGIVRASDVVEVRPSTDDFTRLRLLQPLQAADGKRNATVWEIKRRADKGGPHRFPSSARAGDAQRHRPHSRHNPLLGDGIGGLSVALPLCGRRRAQGFYQGAWRGDLHRHSSKESLKLLTPTSR